MERELALRLAQQSISHVSSIYFGGGTPSLLNAHEIARFLDLLSSKYSLEGIEITLEANPDDLSKNKLNELKLAGINRLSIGIQSFFEEDLRWMNRSHNAQQAETCLDNASALGFKNLNADLIFGYPLLSDDKWQGNMEKMLEYPINHLSTYSMTVESGTALHHAIIHKKEKPMEEGQAEKQYRMIMKFLESKGWEHYEISNFCLPGNPSQHNSAYWSGEPYLGIGPSAHGYNGSERYWNIANNAQYLRGIDEGILPEEIEILKRKDQLNEMLLTRLRTAQGLNKAAFFAKFEQRALTSLIHQIQTPEMLPYFFMDDAFIRLNKEGFLLADYLISQLFEVDH